MKKTLLLIFISLVFLGCSAKDTKTAGGNMMSAAGSGGLAAPLFFAAGGLVFLAGSSAEEDTNNKNIDVNKSSYVVSSSVDNNKTFVPYETKITVSDVIKKEDNNETTQDK
ncbi:hypothetical protein FA592_13390 [Sulfurospirillum diekertiae]|uniref:Uncharacterized protein n=1 Tax=Sulfurospirillum diekertiae TaxID=1854492 RepID=A0A6G9VW42_9BACT|nr:hypothetical protein [Sulfurospirillum diekertiae]QIR77173.1 hypothetical protein FA584_13595 [Sulfurospirillum diekertiae]QIR79787.1 hypothetical protein FA592_13390 [Sulfurospirillum diekertiae]